MPAHAAGLEPRGPVGAGAPRSSEATDERFATTRDGWRVDYRLRLPAVTPAQAKRLRRACIAWLFQGQAAPRPTVAASGEAALATFIADGGAGSGSERFSERSVEATHRGGGWLALCRRERSSSGGNRSEALIVELDDVRALTLDEIVPPARQAGLRLLLAAELRRSRNLPASGPLTTDVASDTDLPIPVPLLSADDARFVWNPGELSPVSDGAYEAMLTSAQLRGVFAVELW